MVPLCHDISMDQDDEAPRSVPANWLGELEQSRADVAAGRLVSGEVVMEGLRRTIDRMEAEHAAKHDTAVPHR